MVISSTNSRISRVQPVFSWLKANGGDEWPARLVQLAIGGAQVPACGSVSRVDLDPEAEVSPTPARLAWMIRNVNRLAPRDGRQWKSLRQRVTDSKAVQKALELLDAGSVRGVPPSLLLEGKTHADCLIECESAFIWIEGKRFDWLSPSTTWDVTRDQLARNVEAVWSIARASGKDYRLLICHEDPLKHHEVSLVDGYRRGTWAGGWPHIAEDQRREFATRIGIASWCAIANEWPQLWSLPELHDLDRTQS
jgi:hypothetical protein